jgi:hypothetical protein
MPGITDQPIQRGGDGALAVGYGRAAGSGARRLEPRSERQHSAELDHVQFVQQWLPAQLPSGLRANSPLGLTEPVKLPAALANSPVPPSMCTCSWVVARNRQLCGSTLDETPTVMLTRCMVPTG